MVKRLYRIRKKANRIMTTAMLARPRFSFCGTEFLIMMRTAPRQKAEMIKIRVLLYSI